MSYPCNSGHLWEVLSSQKNEPRTEGNEYSIKCCYSPTPPSPASTMEFGSQAKEHDLFLTSSSLGQFKHAPHSVHYPPLLITQQLLNKCGYCSATLILITFNLESEVKLGSFQIHVKGLFQSSSLKNDHVKEGNPRMLPTAFLCDGTSQPSLEMPHGLSFWDFGPFSLLLNFCNFLNHKNTEIQGYLSRSPA